ncbi:hypothetical protein D3C87_1354340 [compost metagenome]
MSIRIGISGWRFPPWRKVFFPKGLIQNDELHYASRQVNSIEINGTFYATQTPKSYKHWYDETPDDFVFAVKGPQYITHIRRLKDIQGPLANFYASGVLHLQQKLGPMLWQFPPNFPFDEERLESFFKLLPHEVKAAVKLAKQADRLEPDFPEDAAKSNQKLRHAIEIRNHSFENPFFIELLRKYDVALVFADTAGRWPYLEDITSDFIYLRLHGDEDLYASGYGDEMLNWWGARVKAWHSGQEPKNSFALLEDVPKASAKDVYVYFDNDVKVHAPFDAQKLMKILKIK